MLDCGRRYQGVCNFQVVTLAILPQQVTGQLPRPIVNLNAIQEVEALSYAAVLSGPRAFPNFSRGDGRKKNFIARGDKGSPFK